MDFSTSFCGQIFQNPLVLASGILGVTGGSMASAVQNGAGGVTGKSLHKEYRPGHKNPTIVANETYMLNAVGLSGEGIEEGLHEQKEYKKQYPSHPLLANFFADTIEDYAEATKLMDVSPAEILEVNISCPNVASEFGHMFSSHVKSAEAVTKIVRKNTKKPFVVKLSPNVHDITEIARACEAAGADGITAVNTLLGMSIDPEFRTPVLTNKIGGISGPALKPIAIRCVWQIAKSVQIPIIGTGGITTGRDAIEMLMAGATLVGIGSAVYYRGKDVFKKIVQEMEEWGEKEGVKDLEEIRGVAL